MDIPLFLLWGKNSDWGYLWTKWWR